MCFAPIDDVVVVIATRDRAARHQEQHFLQRIRNFPRLPRVLDRRQVIVFNHGWLAVNPGAYGAWFDHLVRSGYIVIFPRYQTDAFTRPSEFLPNALAATSDALDVLLTAPGHVQPDLDRFALIGHSAGGNLAAQMAAVAARGRRRGTPLRRRTALRCAGLAAGLR